jgi:hypothetical protein
MPRFNANPEWMDKALKHVRKGFARDEIDVPYKVEMRETGDWYSHSDEEVGGALLTLPARFSATPK